MFAIVTQGQAHGAVENGRSLVIIFDTTWSMDDDLQELKRGAAYIVKEMMKRTDNPIYNYVFVPFNDPCELKCIWERLSLLSTRDNEFAQRLSERTSASLIFTNKYSPFPVSENRKSPQAFNATTVLGKFKW